MFRDPSGRERPAQADRSGILSFALTEAPGLYELRSGGAVLEAYPVSLLSAAETDVGPKGEIRLGSQTVQARAEAQEARDLWKWLVLAALAGLLLEWWVYWKRVV